MPTSGSDLADLGPLSDLIEKNNTKKVFFFVQKVCILQKKVRFLEENKKIMQKLRNNWLILRKLGNSSVTGQVTVEGKEIQK